MANKDPELLNNLKQIFYLVKNHFQQTPDQQEHWQMPPANYTGQQRIADDCDGFCLACRTLLRQRNIPNRLVYCEIDGGGHLVVEVNGWILDNRQKTVVPNTLLTEYRWLRISGFEARDSWREILL
ncbi:transglutaminase-like cysteine peptidase [Oceanicoccus sp. KOV_DT_Chl]|uniref:transglutaminase-like cysteine peptidase n=1 Tax=Oceanicoccus sp. KOV_DT_Chl TaxID=1904639 RepID=UPI000C7B20AE|nr:transglutaminase-like cysteine peptidase [Oceanicoccus sp. KOV_DT_Chl]